MTRKRAIYKVTLTKAQNAQMAKCGNETLEVGAFFGEASQDYGHFVNTDDLITLLGLFSEPIEIVTMG